MRLLKFCFTLICLPLMSFAANQAFPKTDVGAFEVKTLPAARLIASHTDANYFEQNNGLFRPLFNYIRTRDIAMTTPVEAEITPGVMYFYIGAEVDANLLEDTPKVSVHTQPERMVASFGARGSYSQTNFEEAADTLRTWLAEKDGYEVAGKARGVFWNSPFMPGFFKRFEVHVPVKRTSAQTQ